MRPWGPIWSCPAPSRSAPSARDCSTSGRCSRWSTRCTPAQRAHQLWLPSTPLAFAAYTTGMVLALAAPPPIAAPDNAIPAMAAPARIFLGGRIESFGSFSISRRMRPVGIDHRRSNGADHSQKSHSSCVDCSPCRYRGSRPATEPPCRGPHRCTAHTPLPLPLPMPPRGRTRGSTSPGQAVKPLNMGYSFINASLGRHNAVMYE